MRQLGRQRATLHYGAAVSSKMKEYVSYCTLSSRLWIDKRWWYGSISSALALDENDIAQGFKEAAMLVAIMMLMKNTIPSPHIDGFCADAQLPGQFSGRQHASLT